MLTTKAAFSMSQNAWWKSYFTAFQIAYYLKTRLPGLPEFWSTRDDVIPITPQLRNSV